MTLNRALSSLVIVVLFAVGGLFVITKYSDAQEATMCPAGTELAADGASCLSPLLMTMWSPPPAAPKGRCPTTVRLASCPAPTLLLRSLLR